MRYFTSSDPTHGSSRRADIVDAPTVRILGFMLDDLHTQLVEGEMMIQDLASTMELRRRAGDWQTHLDFLLAGSHGVAGLGTIGGRPKIQAPPKAVLGSALRAKWDAEGRDPKAKIAEAPAG